MTIESALPYISHDKTVWRMHIDGSVKSNHKEGAAGFCLFADDKLYFAQSRKLFGDYLTSNYAEFQALVLALKYAHEHCYLEPTIYTDSEAVTIWSKTKTNTKEGNIRLIRAAILHYSQFLDYTAIHVRREEPHQRFCDFICNMGYLGNASFTNGKQHRVIIGAYYTSPFYT